MPVDLSVFERQKTIVDQQQLQDAFELKKAMAGAELQKALKPADFDLKDLGQKALVKRQLGLPTSPEENAYADVYNASTEGIYTDFQGNVVRRPGIMERLGGNNLPVAPSAPAATPAVGASFRSSMAPVASAQTGNMGSFPGVDDAQVGGFPKMDKAGQETQVNDFIAANPMPKTPMQKRQESLQQELAAAQGNPKLQQTIREKYIAADSPTVKFEQENKLRDEFTATTKPFRELQDAYSKVQNISDSAAGDIALLYATAKLNDPTSVVRESEFAIQAAAGNLGDRMQNLVQKVTSGNRLTPSQRQDLKSETDNLYRAQLGNYEQSKKIYGGIAYNNGLDVNNVIADYANPATQKPAVSSVKEGTTATNPATGQKITFRNGAWQ